jgi:arginase family enzyme
MNPMVSSREHWEWFTNRGGRVSEVGAVAMDARPHFVSLDLDCLDSAYAPGVSALNPCGMTPREVAAVVGSAARSGRLKCFDIMELNPAFDADGRTARLAAHMFLEVVRGLSAREQGLSA